MSEQIIRPGSGGFAKSLSDEDIEHRFGFHKATIEGPEATAHEHAYLRRQFVMFAEMLAARIPASREATLMFTALEEASMWSHKAIAMKDPLVVETVEDTYNDSEKAASALWDSAYENTEKETTDGV